MHPVIKEIEAPHLKTDIPHFRPGDTVRVAVRIVEGDKERIQDYQGVVIARRGTGLRETLVVRRVSFGVGMERTFQIHSPRIESISVVRRGKVRRAKLYYLRNLRGKKARLSERRVSQDKLAAEAASAKKPLLDQIAQAEESQAVLEGAPDMPDQSLPQEEMEAAEMEGEGAPVAEAQPEDQAAAPEQAEEEPRKDA